VTSYETLLVEVAAPLTTVTVNRPKVLNALDGTTLSELTDAFLALERRGDIRCVVLTGAGDKAFVAGADIAAMAELPPAEARAFAERGHRLMTMMEAAPFPIVAAVNGFALGGGLELALACDFAVASSTAKLGLPEVGLGVIPGFGGLQRLARRVGIGRARELAFTGNVIGAAEALRIGLVNAVAEPDALAGAVRTIADKIAGRAPLAVAAAKRALREGPDLSLGEALALETQLWGDLFATADQREGMRAFLEKRPPRFEGR
jgi:enoyl-CoA hydratase